MRASAVGHSLQTRAWRNRQSLSRAGVRTTECLVSSCQPVIQGSLQAEVRGFRVWLHVHNLRRSGQSHREAIASNYRRSGRILRSRLHDRGSHYDFISLNHPVNSTEASPVANCVVVPKTVGPTAVDCPSIEVNVTGGAVTAGKVTVPGGLPLA